MNKYSNNMIPITSQNGDTPRSDDFSTPSGRAYFDGDAYVLALKKSLKLALNRRSLIFHDLQCGIVTCQSVTQRLRLENAYINFLEKAIGKLVGKNQIYL